MASLGKKLSAIKYHRMLVTSQRSSSSVLGFFCQRRAQPIYFILFFFLLCALILPNPRLNPFLSYSSNDSSSRIVCLYENANFAQSSEDNSLSPFCTTSEFTSLLETNSDFILLEPDFLVHLLQKQGATNKQKYGKDGSWETLKFRFDLPAKGFGSSSNFLTVGILYPKLKWFSTLNQGNFTLYKMVKGRVVSSKKYLPFHFIFRRQSYLPWTPTLYLHVVVFHPVAEYFWVGAIPGEVQKKLTSDGLHLHFGLTEAIFDPFTPAPLKTSTSKVFDPASHHKISVPSDIPHFLSQLPTSRYLHCPPERTAAWLKDANQTIDSLKEAISLAAIRDLKAVARYMRMEVWLACGTLLGWFRQCTRTPFTTDTDFATWTKYSMAEANIAASYIEAVKALGTRSKLYQTYGEKTATQEFSFYNNQEKVDLFTVYPNGTHFLMPYHSDGVYAYSIYPPFTLCSVAFLGLKVNAPCDPEAVIVSEYGPEWRLPLPDYNYISQSHNSGTFHDYNFTGPQHVYF